METSKYEAIVNSATGFTDEEVTQLVQALLQSHRLVINPQIVVQVQKLPENNVASFKNETTKENKEESAQ